MKYTKEKLEKAGYDGLYYPGECACHKNKLYQCNHEESKNCKPGFLQNSYEDYFQIGPEKVSWKVKHPR